MTALVIKTFFCLISLQLKVTRPDGSPATGSKVRVTISRGWYGDNKFYNKTFVVTNGLITDSINDGTYNARSLVMKVIQNGE